MRLKYPTLTAAVVRGGSRALSLEDRIRRLEDALAHACSAIDDVSWDGVVPAAGLRPLADFFLEIQRERELEALLEKGEIQDTVRTIAGEHPR